MLMDTNTNAPSNFIRNIIVPETIYTVVLSIVVYQLIYIVNQKIEKNEKNNRKIF